MEKVISFLNWREKFEDLDIDSIGRDFILLEENLFKSTSDYPFKIDVTAVIICVKGTIECSINLKPVKAVAPCFLVLLPEQILEHESVSNDFSGYMIAMSKKFTDNLLPNAQEQLPLFLSVREKPVVELDGEGLEGMVSYYNMLKRIVKVRENPHRLEVARYLTLAFFYGIGFSIHKTDSGKKSTHYEKLVEKFMNLVQIHHKQERSLEFYADKIHLTPKHLAKVIKETTNKTANNWIDEHVILEAKALLKSTNMTTQQISGELNFSDQSFFGKYFKRQTGMSPREYKGK
ncbi:MAG: helix-turn-helix domain-containing protein [Tannerella sp.]|nr:helix-turn-helix domain-containing protein [Tannerella sp.]